MDNERDQIFMLQLAARLYRLMVECTEDVAETGFVLQSVLEIAKEYIDGRESDDTEEGKYEISRLRKAIVAAEDFLEI